ncbi:hypothetical protein TorRG33x02_194810 [Trema orientale]|uniref:Uncharacterized protein n=1 Tax=Trema orientale TaxID=63057 RepID=A0A2P5EGU1_TREOI|nr:hypothetical protein TorRG33x02_194810 [Trema orientale]
MIIISLGFLTKSVLVVMHPNLEHVTLDPSLVTELLDQFLILLLNPPSQPLRQPQHPLLLLLAKLGPKPLLIRRPGPESIPTSASSASTSTARVRDVLLVLAAVAPGSAAGRRGQSQRPMVRRHVEVPGGRTVVRREWRVRVVGHEGATVGRLGSR